MWSDLIGGFMTLWTENISINVDNKIILFYFIKIGRKS